MYKAVLALLSRVCIDGGYFSLPSLPLSMFNKKNPTPPKKKGERQTDFPAPDLPIGWANTGGLSVLILRFWQTEQPFGP